MGNYQYTNKRLSCIGIILGGSFVKYTNVVDILHEDIEHMDILNLLSSSDDIFELYFSDSDFDNNISNNNKRICSNSCLSR